MLVDPNLAPVLLPSPPCSSLPYERYARVEGSASGLSRSDRGEKTSVVEEPASADLTVFPTKMKLQSGTRARDVFVHLEHERVVAKQPDPVPHAHQSGGWTKMLQDSRSVVTLLYWTLGWRDRAIRSA